MSVTTVDTPKFSRSPTQSQSDPRILAAWGGWALDGMDSFIYALVLVPSLRDLLPRSGIAATKGNIGFYGGLLFALFLVGWGLAFLWGPVGDKFGRVRTLMITIIWYSVFTFLSALVNNVWQLAVLRLLAGIGIGGEWPWAAPSLPKSGRKIGVAPAQATCTPVITLESFSPRLPTTRLGADSAQWMARHVRRWRTACIVVGGNSARRHGAVTLESQRARGAFLGYLAAVCRTIFAVAAPPHHPQCFVHAGIHQRAMGRHRVRAGGGDHAGRSRRSSQFRGTARFPGDHARCVATILGCLLMPWLAERLGRRGALACYFALMLVFIVLTFGKVFYMGPSALPLFFVCLFFLGLGGANFAVYTLWLPEQYPTECRASAFAFATSLARFGGAAITFLVGAGVQHYGSLGIPVAMTSLAFAVGLLLIPFGVETRGQALPLKRSCVARSKEEHGQRRGQGISHRGIARVQHPHFPSLRRAQGGRGAGCRRACFG